MNMVVSVKRTSVATGDVLAALERSGRAVKPLGRMGRHVQESV